MVGAAVVQHGARRVVRALLAALVQVSSSEPRIVVDAAQAAAASFGGAALLQNLGWRVGLGAEAGVRPLLSVIYVPDFQLLCVLEVLKESIGTSLDRENGRWELHLGVVAPCSHVLADLGQLGSRLVRRELLPLFYPGQLVILGSSDLHFHLLMGFTILKGLIARFQLLGQLLSVARHRELASDRLVPVGRKNLVHLDRFLLLPDLSLLGSLPPAL